MIVVMKPTVREDTINFVKSNLEKYGVEVNVSKGGTYCILGLVGDSSKIDSDKILTYEGVEKVLKVQDPFKKANRLFKPDDSIINVNGTFIGGGNLGVMAGPCSVESEEQIVEVARAVKNSGANFLRGGAFKPRTSPYSFQGLELEGLRLLEIAKKETGLNIVTEIMSTDYIDEFVDRVDVIQVGARNLFNAAFERGLMGLKLGETYNLNVTFAEDDADPDVAGKTITFSVEVNAKFNDAYAKKMSKNKYPNVKAYYEYAKAKEEKENREGIGDTVWEDLLKECNVKKYPAGSRKQAYKDQKRSYQVFAKVSGQSYEEFIGALGQTDEDIQSSADDQVKARMTAKTIAIKEGLTLSDADYERFLLAFLEPEEEEDKTLKAMEKRYIEEQSCYPRDDMLIELVKEYLGKNSKMK